MALEAGGKECVVQGATVKCTKGEITTTLIATKNTRIGTHLVISETDTADKNFAGKFGRCRQLKLPCMRCTLPKWFNTETALLVDGETPVATVASFAVCILGAGAILPVNSGQEFQTSFALPEEYQKQIDAIKAGASNNKANEIRMVYERFLYNTDKEAFDEYAKVCADYKRGTVERNEADRILGEVLQAGDIDVRSVTRALVDDILSVTPRTGHFKSDAKTFIDLVTTSGPLDIKNQGIYQMLDMELNSAYGFSIWAREWEKGMTPDYTGNYAFGYNGAAYWEGLDGDMFNIACPGTIPDRGFRKAADIVRATTSNLTDAERFLLFGGGVEQFGSDLKGDLSLKTVIKYSGSIISGNFGDNEGDSDFIKDGINDYYCYKNE